MTRSLRSPRFPVAQAGQFGDLAPVSRALVSPGETLKSLRFQMRLQSLPIKFPLTGAYVRVSFYYVPIRLVWPAFADVAMGVAATLPPVIAASQAKFFSPQLNGPTLYGLCYQHVVNTFHRQNDESQYTYDGSTFARARYPDSTAEFRTAYSGEYADQSIVVGADDTFTLRELDTARAKMRYATRMEQAGGHYSQYLQMFGVDADAADVVDAEELGVYSKWVMPSKSIDPLTGNTAQSYFHDCRFELKKRRYFPEHGYIIGLVSVQPKLLIDQVSPVDDLFTASRHWPHPGQMGDDKTFNNTPLLTDVETTTNMRSFTDHYLLHGHQLTVPVGTGSFSYRTDPGTVAQLRFPTYTSFVTSAGNLGSGGHFEIDGVTTISVATPLTLEPGLK